MHADMKLYVVLKLLVVSKLLLLSILSIDSNETYLLAPWLRTPIKNGFDS